MIQGRAAALPVQMLPPSRPTSSPSSPSTSPRSPAGRGALASPAVRACLLAAILLGALACAHDFRRWAQVAALALPPVVWLLWPLRATAARRLRAVGLWSWTAAFAVDAAVRGYLSRAYDAAPGSALVVTSVANTSHAESLEYLALSWPAIVPWAALALAAAIGAAVVLHADAMRGPAPAPAPATRAAARARVALLAALLPVSAVGYAIKPWRRLHPVAYWPAWAGEVDAHRASWADLQRWRDDASARAVAEGARLADPRRPSTVVLVLADSVNRDNLGLYDYPRDTTPHLERLRDELGDAMVVFAQAWSAHAGTIPAVRSLLQFGAADPADTAHVLALARAAGVRLWWISTHDDIAIEQAHARFAHVVHMASRTPGRSSRTPDDAVLEPLRAALADPAPHKLVVVHLMGAHPHYRLRYPAGDNPFDDGPDAVSRSLSDSGRAFWVRAARDHYDAALRHHDRVVARTLELVRAHRPEGGDAAWLYLSDHGQEVGHEIDHAGHSAATEAGYRIPAIVWRGPARPSALAHAAYRPFRADWAAWTLAELAGLRWAGRDPTRDALAGAYRWRPPEIGARVARLPPAD